MKTTIKEKILNYLETSSKKSFSMEELSQDLELNKGDDFKALVQTIATMEREKSIIFTKKGKVQLPLKEVLVEGIFRANDRGFGFVSIEGEENDVYISKDHTGFALNGDTVRIDILSSPNQLEGKTAEGKVKEIVKRSMTQVVGEFIPYSEEERQETDLYGYVKPQDKKLSNYKIFIAAEGIQPVEGTICVVEVTHYPEPGYPTALEGLIKQTVGHKNDPGMDILSIVMQHGIPTKFPDDVLTHADQIPDEISEEDMTNRRDIRDQILVTIDGADAKDLDDAVTVKKLANGHYFLGVHIADVSHYVTEGSPMDLEAYERATSVYLTDRVIPMIPHRLSNGICSLNPKVPRLAMSCEMEIDETGTVVSYDIFESVIQTAERMTYKAVNEILEDENPETIARYDSLVPMFKEMGELHQLLEKMRVDRGAISFEDREAKILVDEAGHPVDIELRSRGIGERLIESFMLMANETVAKHYCDLKLPFIYRIHEQPKEDKVQRFFEFITNFGIVVRGTKEDISPKELQKVLNQVIDRPEEAVINKMLLRSMQQARYSEDSVGHYGLAADYYTHFTSPIRRYPDLIVHRLIKSYLTQPVAEETKEKWNSHLPDIATHSSQMERRAVEAERDTNALKKAEFMVDKVGLEFEGVIGSVTKFGMFIELPNTVEGLIHVNQLPEYFHFVESHLALVGERTGTTYKIGQKVVIKVTKADPATREVDFELVSVEELPESDKISILKRDRRGGKPTGRNRQNDRQPRDKDKKAYHGKAKGKSGKGGKKPFYKEAVKNKKGKKKKSNR
ncbi:ribonuclease R [Vagococcus coleopterorum]|uniref:Ribonuclease R n=1 Tax=Vagococcus coleopterorum TaxID=2714946 RepID=A0A6G8AP34_9ENTE|nr:ribonuclease R [Vagococcus coleopterorum]QIL46683.1 ribonuclease R [Vagococcus coleopterorum]